jgi:Nuclear transport factor 2 (NTF2) domain
LTFEGQQFQGTNNIIQKLTSIGPVSHQVATTDVQPSAPNANAICIFVTGSIKIGGPDGNPLHFCEFFQLVSTAPGA